MTNPDDDYGVAVPLSALRELKKLYEEALKPEYGTEECIEKMIGAIPAPVPQPRFTVVRTPGYLTFGTIVDAENEFEITVLNEGISRALAQRIADAMNTLHERAQSPEIVPTNWSLDVSDDKVHPYLGQLCDNEPTCVRLFADVDDMVYARGG